MEKPESLSVVAAGVVSRGHQILVTRRKEGVPYGLCWELPGGKLESGEPPERALLRELQEELGVRVRVGTVQDVVFYRYPETEVLLLFYACDIVGGEPRPLDCADLRWVARSELESLEWVKADLAFVRKLARRPP